MYNDCELCKKYDEREFDLNDVGDWTSNNIPFVYCLMLEEGKYYVGKTRCLSRRIFAHFGYGGSKWTKKYQPIAILFLQSFDNNITKEELSEIENMYTIFYMEEYGRDNVRGGLWTTSYPLTDKWHIKIDKYQNKIMNSLCS